MNELGKTFLITVSQVDRVNGSERSALFFICGYIARKGALTFCQTLMTLPLMKKLNVMVTASSCLLCRAESWYFRQPNCLPLHCSLTLFSKTWSLSLVGSDQLSFARSYKDCFRFTFPAAC